jgi:alpha-tubulin suppressor-like RCC1 family protein
LHSCAIDAQQALWCWGDNRYDQLGTGRRDFEPRPVRVLDGVVAVQARQRRTCAASRDGTIRCWGGLRRRSETGPFDRMEPPVQARTVEAVEGGNAARGFHAVRAMAITADMVCAAAGEEVLCWQDDDAWVMRGVPDVVSLTVNRDEVCALTSARRVRCASWGDETLYEIEEALGAIAMEGSDESLCFVLPGGRVRCLEAGQRWGTDGSRVEDVAVVPGAVALSIADGERHACVVTDAGAVSCWGGIATASAVAGDHSHDVKHVLLPAPATAIALGAAHGCARLGDGRTFCWGSDSHGERGDGRGGPLMRGELVVGAEAVAALAAGDHHNCIINKAGYVGCWGRNDEQQLGDRKHELSSRLVPVDGIYQASQLVAGRAHSCALIRGRVHCWGDNDAGQLGGRRDGERSNYDGITALPDVHAIAAGGDASCARTTRGEVWCWGTLGAAGGAPARQPGLAGASDLAVGRDHVGGACAVLRDGTVRCVGDLERPEGGLSTRSALHMGVKAIVAGRDHACAMTSRDDVWCWGSIYGVSTALGRGVRATSRGLPEERGRTLASHRKAYPVSDLDAATFLASGEVASCSIADSRVACWGALFHTPGQQAVIDFGDIPIPVALGSAQAVAIGAAHVCALTTDQRVRCLGDNSFGQLGRDDPPSRWRAFEVAIPE